MYRVNGALEAVQRHRRIRRTSPEAASVLWLQASALYRYTQHNKLECRQMLNVMAALSNIGGALCSTLQSLADAHY